MVIFSYLVNFQIETYLFIVVSLLLLSPKTEQLLGNESQKIVLLAGLPMVMTAIFALDGLIDQRETVHTLVAFTISLSMYAEEFDEIRHIQLGFNAVWLTTFTTIIFFSILSQWYLFAVISLFLLTFVSPELNFTDIEKSPILLWSVFLGLQTVRLLLSGGISPEVRIEANEYHILMLRYISAPIVGLAIFESVKGYLEMGSYAMKADEKTN